MTGSLAQEVTLEAAPGHIGHLGQVLDRKSELVQPDGERLVQQCWHLGGNGARFIDVPSEPGQAHAELAELPLGYRRRGNIDEHTFDEETVIFPLGAGRGRIEKLMVAVIPGEVDPAITPVIL